MKPVYAILRDLREDCDMKQADIAEILGTTQQYYSKYETGKYELPLRFVTTLADFYKVSTDYLLGRTECRDGIDGVNKLIVGDHTTGEMISNVLSLSQTGRKEVLDYIALQIKVRERDKLK